MATLGQAPARARGDDGFFLTMAFVIAGIVVSGFSLQLAMGRSSFASPPLVHAHAIVFMGWMGIYLLQNWFATRGPVALHRRLGWIAVAWVAVMVVLGPLTAITMARQARVPFFFQPLHFVVFDSVDVFAFAALVFSGVALRRHTHWHRRLNYCGMALLTGAAFGRLLPVPLLMPWAYHAAFFCSLMLPVAGVVADLRRDGRVHPAWFWGIGGMLVGELLTDIIVHSPLGLAFYRVITAGSPGAAVAPLAFGAIPG